MSDAGIQAPGDKATLHYPGGTAEFPILRGTEGASAIDMATLTRQTGLTSLDYGFVNTASTKSAITYIDGDEGILRYRGYPIEQLATSSTYLEVAWLLLYGELPTPSELAEFDERVRRHTLLHEDLKHFFSALPHTAHPMSVLSSAVSALSTYYENESDPNNPEHVELNTVRMLAKLPVIAAYAHKKSVGQAFLYPDNSLSFVDNFLKLNFGNNAEPYEVNPVMSRALERLLILHEDHEQNASTSTVRLVGSTGSNQFSSISAGISALYGPLHGGANEAVLDMLGRIRDSGESVQRFVERVKNKEDGVKLMGFGHRVYKNYDPRAKLVKESADEVLEALGVSDPLLDLAKELEQIALEDDYFKERRLYPNVDFYTGVIYKAMGFP
ncbi:MAG TPA: citrate synthase, partial [Microbacteriaceae bacterium]|nr:citrate synthase [Microbacteriaceae bacterium]